MHKDQLRWSTESCTAVKNRSPLLHAEYQPRWSSRARSSARMREKDESEKPMNHWARRHTAKSTSEARRYETFTSPR